MNVVTTFLGGRVVVIRNTLADKDKKPWRASWRRGSSSWKTRAGACNAALRLAQVIERTKAE